MKVAITGSAGFIGSNLVEACLLKGWDVIGIDNLSTGFLEMTNANRFGGSGKYQWCDLDVNDTSELYHAFLGYDVVFHLAALARVPFSIDHPLEANMANITGTLSVLEAARTAGVKRVVFSCSSSIFGGSNIFPTPEDTEHAPLSPYALQKSAGATYCKLYSELHGLETVSLTYYNVYGKYQRANSAYATVIPAFFEAASEGKSCRIDGDGGQSRDFCHVDNVVQANILAAEHGGKLMGELFNVANGETHSVREVFDSIKSYYGGNVKSYGAPARLGDPRKSLADISKAVKVLGYKPKVGFKEGLKKTADWWQGGCKI